MKFCFAVFAVPAESLPQTNTKIVILAVCGALILLIAVAIAACFAVRVIQNRHDYEG